MTSPLTKIGQAQSPMSNPSHHTISTPDQSSAHRLQSLFDVNRQILPLLYWSLPDSAAIYVGVGVQKMCELSRFLKLLPVGQMLVA